jgi:MFS family permease
MVLLGGGLYFLLTFMTDVSGSGWSYSLEPELVASVVLLAGFIVWELRSKSPVLDFSLLRQRVLTASILAAFFQSLAGFAVFFLLIMYLQGPRGLSPWNASLLLVPGNVLGALMAPYAGRLSDRFGARVIASAGLFCSGLAMLTYWTLTMGSSFYVVILGSVLSGAGSSTFFPANNSAVMANAPRRAYGIANGLLRTFSNIGMVSSFAVALFFASISVPRQLAFSIFLGVGQITGTLALAFIDGMHTALMASISILAVAFVLSVLRGKEARADSANKWDHEGKPSRSTPSGSS